MEQIIEFELRVPGPLVVHRGVFRGWGKLGHGPPLGRQDSIISIEKCAKLWHGPPFVTCSEGLGTETVGEGLFLAKNRTKFE